MGLTWSGHGEETFLSEEKSQLSYFSNHGQVTDNVTGYIGTPQEIAKRYIDENRNLDDLRRRMGK